MSSREPSPPCEARQRSRCAVETVSSYASYAQVPLTSRRDMASCAACNAMSARIFQRRDTAHTFFAALKGPSFSRDSCAWSRTALSSRASTSPRPTVFVVSVFLMRSVRCAAATANESPRRRRHHSVCSTSHVATLISVRSPCRSSGLRHNALAGAQEVMRTVPSLSSGTLKTAGSSPS